MAKTTTEIVFPAPLRMACQRGVSCFHVQAGQDGAPVRAAVGFEEEIEVEEVGGVDGTGDVEDECCTEAAYRHVDHQVAVPVPVPDARAEGGDDGQRPGEHGREPAAAPGFG